MTPLFDLGPPGVPAFDERVFFPRRARYCCIVFVLNENGRIRAQLGKMQSQARTVDIIIADGGSSDGSLDIDLLQSSGVRALITKRGPGRLATQQRMAFHWALREGYEGIITVDGNDKDDTSAIPRFVDRLAAGDDHVQGSRYVPGGQAINTPPIRHLAVRFIHAPLVSFAAKFHYTDTTNGFRAYSRRFLEDLRVQPLRDVFVGYELHYYLAIRAGELGFRVSEVPVIRAYPRAGPIPTKISPIRGNLNLFGALLRAVLHHFDPAEP